MKQALFLLNANAKPYSSHLTFIDTLNRNVSEVC